MKITNTELDEECNGSISFDNGAELLIELSDESDELVETTVDLGLGNVLEDIENNAKVVMKETNAMRYLLANVKGATTDIEYGNGDDPDSFILCMDITELTHLLSKHNIS